MEGGWGLGLEVEWWVVVVVGLSEIKGMRVQLAVLLFLLSFSPSSPPPCSQSTQIQTKQSITHQPTKATHEQTKTKQNKNASLGASVSGALGAINQHD